jgi:hypothetical protein
MCPMCPFSQWQGFGETTEAGQYSSAKARNWIGTQTMPQNLTRLMLGLLREASEVDGLSVTDSDRWPVMIPARRGLVEITVDDGE